jgi:uracil-DNA glycosylase family protein
VGGTRRARESPTAGATKGESLEALRLRAATCKRCDLWKSGTQTVFGEGPARAELMLVGEQPGDVEDRRGEPFVGPAGQLLRKALAEAGIDQRRVYFTNAVKHFKWTPRGKRRIHERPNHEEVLACHLWLEAEIAQVKPRVLVALGATAAAALLGSTVRVTRDRAQPLDSLLADIVTVTVHPSSILRSPDSESRAAAFAQFVDDLRHIVRLSPAGGASPTRTGKP